MIPEHNPIEMEPDAAADASGSAHVHTHAPGSPDARGVIVACLVQVLPCPVCSGTEPCRCLRPDDYSATAERAALIEQALIHYGFLPDPGEPEQEFDAEATAMWLAERSGFARYTQVKDGWKRLMESEIDVDLATLNALKRVPTSEIDMVKAAKAALLSWHQSNSTTPGWMR